jgi:hypothetical protein
LDVAIARGELPQGCDTDELAGMITALAMDACLLWAMGDHRRLRSVLRGRADVVLAGAAASMSSGRPSRTRQPTR